LITFDGDSFFGDIAPEYYVIPSCGGNVAGDDVAMTVFIRSVVTRYRLTAEEQWSNCRRSNGFSYFPKRADRLWNARNPPVK
jgi:hypothetical protein